MATTTNPIERLLAAASQRQSNHAKEISPRIKSLVYRLNLALKVSQRNGKLVMDCCPECDMSIKKGHSKKCKLGEAVALIDTLNSIVNS